MKSCQIKSYTVRIGNLILKIINLIFKNVQESEELGLYQDHSLSIKIKVRAFKSELKIE